MTLLDIRAAPADVSLAESVRSQIAAMLRAKVEPTDEELRPLLHRDRLAVALDAVKPGGLTRIIGRTVERLRPYRLAHLYAAGVKPNSAIAVTLESLRAMKTPGARLARCALCDISWTSTKTEEERRVLLARRILIARLP